jgi:hypothetical protein
MPLDTPDLPRSLPQAERTARAALESASSEPAELAQGESIASWAERFARTMAQREAELERRWPRWTPLQLFGLEVR